MWKDATRVFIVVSLLLNASIFVADFSVNTAMASLSLSTNRPCVFVDPPQVTASVGQEFTISVMVFNLTHTYIPDPDFPLVQAPLGDLFGLDINFTWNPAKLEYVSHIVTIPVEDYPKGVLHTDPDYGVSETANDVNSAAGTYHAAYSCFSGAPVFNNPGESSTVFNMTFRVKEKGASTLRLVSTDLSAKPSPGLSQRILHVKFDGYFETPGTPKAAFTYWPPDGKAVKNKDVIFNASESYDPDGTITSYSWDFGDGNTGTGKVVTHSYSTTTPPGGAPFTVTLRVTDNEGTSSAPATKPVVVVERRDIAVRSLSISREKILQNETLAIDITVKNLGDVQENSTVTARYNQTTIDWNNIAVAQWKNIGEKDVVSLTGGGSETVLNLNWTTQSVPAAMYYILANASLVPHDTNATNNIGLSSAVNITTVIGHDIAVTSIKVAVIKGTQEFNQPVILGENATILVRVKAMDTASEIFNTTLRLLAPAPNNTVLDTKSWLNQSLVAGGTKELVFSTERLVAGYCRITVNATILETDGNQTNNNRAETVKVTSPPVLVIASLPSPIYVGDAVTLDATGSNQPGGSLTYKWKIWEPGLNPVEAASSTLSQQVVSYTFTKDGNWTVRLEATDGDGITYDRLRGATSPYQKELKVKVEAKAGWVSPEIIYAAIVVIAVAVVAVLAYLKFRKPKLA